LSINGLRLLDKSNYYSESTYKNAFYRPIYYGKVFVNIVETNQCIIETNFNMNSKINGEFISYYPTGNKYIKCN